MSKRLLRTTSTTADYGSCAIVELTLHDAARLLHLSRELLCFRRSIENQHSGLGRCFAELALHSFVVVNHYGDAPILKLEDSLADREDAAIIWDLFQEGEPIRLTDDELEIFSDEHIRRTECDRVVLQIEPPQEAGGVPHVQVRWEGIVKHTSIWVETVPVYVAELLAHFDLDIPLSEPDPCPVP